MAQGGDEAVAQWVNAKAILDCPHCEEGICLVDGMTIDLEGACLECGNQGENMICLQCHEIHCGRHVNGHMLAHNESTRHPIVCGLTDASFWCYGCESYIKTRNTRIKPVYDLLMQVREQS
jgi:uncharacterized UBP type Zn finger protein